MEIKYAEAGHALRVIEEATRRIEELIKSEESKRRTISAQMSDVDSRLNELRRKRAGLGEAAVVIDSIAPPF